MTENPEVNNQPSDNNTNKETGNSSTEKLLSVPLTDTKANEETNQVKSHYSKAEKKNVKEYLIDFLMVFVAVTLGFFSENYREGLVNREKEQHFIKNLVMDLKEDTAQLTDQLNIQQMQLNNMDSALRISVERLRNVNIQDSFYHEFLPVYSLLNSFIPNNNTISQLKSGGFNLIHREDVVDSITALYNAYETIAFGNDLLKTCFWDVEHVGQQIMKLPPPAVSLSDSILIRVPQNEAVFFRYDESLIHQLYNVIGNERGSLLPYMNFEKTCKDKASRLIAYLTRQYELK